MYRDLGFMRSGDFSYADFLYKFGVTDEVARVEDLVGGRKIYTTSLEVAKINTNKMFTIMLSEFGSIKLLWLCLGPRNIDFYFTIILQIVPLAT